MVDFSNKIRRDLQFKCRRCKKAFDEEYIMVVQKIDGIPPAPPPGVFAELAKSPIEHYCKDGGRGIADLIGSTGPDKPLGNPYD